MRKLFTFFLSLVAVFGGVNHVFGQATPACLPTAASWYSTGTTWGINSFNVTGYLGSTLSDAGIAAAASATTGYLSRTSMTPVNFQQGGVYASSVTWGTTSSYQEVQVWIDFNDDGLFAATEEVSPVSGFSTSGTPSPTTFSITIPVSATPGLHLMRVRGIWERIATTLGVAPAHDDPCLIQYLTTNPQYWSGDIIDYVANIISLCPFTISATNSGPVCPGSPVTITGATTAPTYSWTGPSGYTSTSLSNVVTPSAASTYTFSATNGTCSTAVTTTVGFLPNPGTITIAPTTASICNGGSVAITATIAAASTPIMTQTFNSGMGSWTVDNTGSTGASTLLPWQIMADGYVYGGNTFHSPDATSFAISNGDASGSGTTTHSKLTSPTFSLVGYTSASLSFQHVYQKWTAGDINTAVEISTDGGTTWTVINDFVPTGSIGSPASFATSTYDLSAYIGSVNCKIRFNYNNVWGFWWALDNVIVSGAPVLSPTWSPVTNLFTDPAFTVPYVAGTPAAIVYVHPTTVSTPTTFVYTATLSSATTTCSSTATATVNVSPAVTAISGTALTCVGGTTTLTDGTPGGVWSSSATGTATVNPATGVVTGVAGGTANILYTIGGCSASIVVTVNTAPPAIGGSAITCIGGTTTLTDGALGGSWSSSNTGIATIGSTTGIVTGVATGTATISYQIGTACVATQIVTVTAVPTPITGTLTTCIGLTTTLSESVAGGSWISGSTGVATVGSSTGIVTGVTPGTSVITYTISSGCTVTAIVTVGTISAITGTPVVCAGSTTSLSHAVSGGTWTSGSTGTATVASGTGVVTGVAAGTVVITYTLPTSCYTTMIVTVNPLPSPITGTASVCAGLTTTLADATAGGTWSSSSTSTATVGSATGIVTGIAGGTATITYTIGTGCYVTQVVTVNTISPITGTAFICVGLTATLSDATTGGTWTSGTTSVATVGSTTGIVYGVASGTSNITYTQTATGCFTTTIATVNASPAPVTSPTGVFYVCTGRTLSLADATPFGTWSTSSTATATVDASGVVTGAGSTSSTVTVSYSLGAGCTSVATVTVNPSPAPIVGVVPMCAGTSITLTDATTPGTWSVGGGATIGSSTGIVLGGSGTPPNPIVTYTIPAVGSAAACIATATLTVNPLPSAITGPTSVCQFNTGTLADATSGGTWSSSVPTTANIDAITGVATGLAIGTVTITYTLPTGCIRTRTLSVNPAPGAISGSFGMCVGACTTLTSTTPGGTWSSSFTSIATVGSTNGVACGVSAGNTVMSYTASSGCYVTQIVTVYATPPPISGLAVVCPGTTTTLSSTVTPGTWSIGAPGTGSATISSSGVVTGSTLGTITVTYTTAMGCNPTVVVTVSAPPSPFATGAICPGSTTTLTDPSGTGTWSSGSTGIVSITSAGVATAVSSGTSTITFVSGTTGCSVTGVETVNPSPAAIGGPLSVCVGYTTTLTNSTAGGGTWSIGAPGSGSATINSSGIVTGVTAGTTTVTYTSATTGCTITGVVTVNALPGAITASPSASVCQGSTITMSNASSGGTWSVSSTSIATIDAATGILTGGASTGAVTVTYMIGSGCFVTTTVTVNLTPAPISGTSLLCVGSTYSFTDATGGGHWTSSAPTIASVGSSSGVVTAVAVGTATISYAMATGCNSVYAVTVNPLPANIVAATGPTVCPGTTTTMTDATTGGVWSTTSASATVDAVTGVVTGLSTAGTAVISYTLPVTGCFKTITATVNSTPAPITGTFQVCSGSLITLSDATPGGVWSYGPPGSGTGSIIATSGVFTGGSVAGTTTVTYSTACSITQVITVNPLPVAISPSPAVVCQGSTITLSDASAGGSWSTASPYFSVGSATGIVTGMGSGATATTGVVTYTLPTTCRVVGPVTVNPLPTAISGSTTVCPGTSVALTSSPAGGTWSSSDITLATVGSSSGVVTGVAAGTVTISYTNGTTGCTQTRTETVNPLPAPISGGLAACGGYTSALTDATTGGTWSSSNIAVAQVGSLTGVVTGGIIGTATISYTIPTGCYVTAVFSVNGVPPSITGTKTACPGTTTSLSESTSGTWGTSDPTIASISSSSGTSTVVTGVAPGTATITFTIASGCYTSATVTINTLPAAISGALSVCMGASGTLTDATTGGTWSSSNTAVATVVSSTGVVSSVSVGTSIITYTLGSSGCYSTAVETVNPLPAAITGSTAFCNLTTTTLSDASGGGTWSSADPTIVSVDAVTGEVTGNSVGTTTITYTLPTGCIATRTETIILAPYPITGPTSMCYGNTVTLGNIISGGTWTSSSPAVANMPDTHSSVVNGVGVGVADITYTLSNGCLSTSPMTVDVTPVAITGPLNVCSGLTTTLADATAGGAWTSSDATIASVGTGGVVSGVSTASAASTATITYAMPTGCNATAQVTVNPLPAAIGGTFVLCQGSSTTLSETTSGGTWTSSGPGTASVNGSTGVMTGVDAGGLYPAAQSATITYTLPTGCIATQVVTIDGLPASVTGILEVCAGFNTNLYDATSGGTWSSTDMTVATIGASSGVASGYVAGTSTISYTVPNGCAATAVLTVNPLPAPISGGLSLCEGFTGNLTDATGGGTWSTDGTSSGVGSIDMITGVVAGLAQGTMNVTYTLFSGCQISAVATVNALPSPITGPFHVCEGSVTALGDPDIGGTWSSANPSVASVDEWTGVVGGVTAGVVNITYTYLSTGCFNNHAVTVNPLPAPITGPSVVCQNATITLSDTSSPGAWTTSSTSIANVGVTSGVVTGVSAGTATIAYTLVPSGCARTRVVTVNPIPAPITGPGGICLGSNVSYLDSVTGGTWSITTPSVASITIDTTMGYPAITAHGNSLGTAVISYSLPSTGCYVVKPVTVNGLPSVYTVTGGGHYCSGGAGVPVGLNGSQTGISYAVYYGTSSTSATGYLAGTGAALNFGNMTVGGVYTVLATNGVTGCQRAMAGFANVIVDPLFVPVVSISATGMDTLCPGSLATLHPTTNDTTAPTYTWRVNGVTVSTAGTYSYIPASGDVVTVVLHSTAHCASPVTATDTAHMVVIPTGTPVASISADPGDTICEYNSATFTASSAFGGYSPIYTWLRNGSVAATGSTYTYMPTDGDVITLRLVSNYQCRTADTVYSTNVNMVVQPLTIPHVDVVAYPSLWVATGERDSLTTVVTNAGSHPTYQWYLNGVPIPGATNTWYAAVFNDYDSVTCMVTSSDACHGIASFDWGFVNTHPTGVSNVNSAGDLQLLPNPNKGAFIVRGSLGAAVTQEVTLEVTDMLGQVVYTGKAVAKAGKLNEDVSLTGNLANGMYMLTVHTAIGNKVFHFVIEQ